MVKSRRDKALHVYSQVRVIVEGVHPITQEIMFKLSVAKSHLVKVGLEENANGIAKYAEVGFEDQARDEVKCDIRLVEKSKSTRRMPRAYIGILITMQLFRW